MTRTFTVIFILACLIISSVCIPPPPEMQSGPRQLRPFIKATHLPRYAFTLEKTNTRAMHMGHYLSACYRLGIPDIPRISRQDDLRDHMGQYDISKVEISGYLQEHLLLLVANGIPVMITGKYVETVSKTQFSELKRRATEPLMITGYRSYNKVNPGNTVLRLLSDQVRNIQYRFLEIFDAAAFLPPGMDVEAVRDLFRTYNSRNRIPSEPQVRHIPGRIPLNGGPGQEAARAPIRPVPLPPPLNNDQKPAAPAQKDLYRVRTGDLRTGPGENDLHLLDKLISCYGFVLEERQLRLTYRDMSLMAALCKFARLHERKVYAVKNPGFDDIASLISQGYAGVLYAESDSVRVPHDNAGQILLEFNDLQMWKNATAPYDGLPMGLITVVTGYNPGRMLRMYKTRLLMPRIPEHITAFGYMYILGGDEQEMRKVFSNLPGNGSRLEYFRLESVY